MKLSKRLETVASFVPKGSNIADIGTDHGYVPIYLVREGLAEHGSHGCEKRPAGAR